ncbi:MAG: DinB family protein, partial [Candidatus Methylomirabilales bacterium]
MGDRYRAIRQITERLCAPLSAEDAAIQSMPDASPVKWHLAHTSWFFETFVLEEAVRGYRRFHPEYRVLFNSYYHTVGAQHPRPDRGLLSRPRLEEVLAYRAHVDRHLISFLESDDRSMGTPVDCVETGLQHEQQHQELILTDVKHLFASNPLKPAYHDAPPLSGSAAPPLSWHRYEGGLRW